MLGLEMGLNLLEQDLDEVDKSLIYLGTIRDDLIYNINLHKSGEVISVMKEYKRSIDELEIVRLEIIKYEGHRRMVEQKLERKLKSYDFYLKQYEDEYEALNREPVILLFKKVKDEQKEE